ncbi:MAG: cupin domain-containing protein [Gaiellaceae bacterium]
MDPIVSKPGDGERFERANRVVTIRIDLPQLSVIDLEFDGTFEVDPHTHDDHADAFYVLEGEVEFTTGDTTVMGGPGTVVAASPGARYGFRNAGMGPVRVLNVHAPETGFTDSIRGL